MRRPTIRDLAEAAGVSVATVNRVLAGQKNIRQDTMDRVKTAAEAIGFYGSGAIRSRVAAARASFRFGFLLNQPFRTFYKEVADALRGAIERKEDCRIEARIE